MDQEQIYAKVRDCLVEALDVDEDDVQPEASLREDLEAESIDFVDIVFRLEKAFDVKIPQGELFPQELFSDKRFVTDGKLTADGAKELAERYPYIELDELGEGLPLDEVGKAYTVQMLVRFVQHKLSS